MIGRRGPGCRGLFERIMGMYGLVNGLCLTSCDRTAESSGSQQSRVCPFGFARPLTVSRSFCCSHPLASRYFKVVPRAPSRVLDREIGPRSGVPTLHLFRRSFAVGRARFSFQMSSSLEPFRHSSRSPFTVVVQCSFLSHSSSISPPAACCC